MAKISANRGDIAEGIMGAALTAKFIKRQLGQTIRDLPQVNATDVDAVLAKFFRSGGTYSKTVRDVPKPFDFIPPDFPGDRIETTVNIVRELMFSDKVIFKLTLPQAAMDFLSKQSNRTQVRDIFERAIRYANNDPTFIREANRLATNAKNDKILVDADGVSNQLETKVDIGLYANGRKIGKQISLKTESGRQFDQVIGFGIAEFDKLFDNNMGIIVDGSVKNEVNNYIKQFNVTDAFSFRAQTSKDVTGSVWATKLKKAATIYYKGAEKVIKTQIDALNFRRKLANTIRVGATRGDQDIQLVKFAGAQGAYSERTFGPEFEDAIENADLSVVSNFTDNPTIKINSNNKLLVQFRARVDADKRANGYRIKLRQVLEAGTGLFYL
tara:strand:- start:231 stop:1382 length:1152 start_codon:yes stop_codon:yes gene_type:complete